MFTSLIHKIDINGSLFENIEYFLMHTPAICTQKYAGGGDQVVLAVAMVDCTRSGSGAVVGEDHGGAGRDDGSIASPWRSC